MTKRLDLDNFDSKTFSIKCSSKTKEKFITNTYSGLNGKNYQFNFEGKLIKSFNTLDDAIEYRNLYLIENNIKCLFSYRCMNCYAKYPTLSLREIVYGDIYNIHNCG